MTGTQLHELLRARRSVRRFKQQPPQRRDVEQLIAAAITAPSASNQQPWRFLVVTRSDAIAQMAAAVREAVAEIASHIPEVRRPAFVAYGTYFTRFEDAPIVLVPLFRGLRILSNLVDDDLAADARERIAAMERDSGLIGTSLALENLLLMAEAMGLGASGMTGPLVASHRLREILDVPASWQVLALVPIGYPDEVPRPTERRPLEKVVKWIE